jgi:hypothetical protein
MLSPKFIRFLPSRFVLASIDEITFPPCLGGIGPPPGDADPTGPKIKKGAMDISTPLFVPETKNKKDRGQRLCPRSRIFLYAMLLI